MIFTAQLAALSEWLSEALGNLSRLRIAILAVVVMAAFAVTYGISTSVSSSGEIALEENQRLIPISFGDLAKGVAINGSITFANKEALTFGSQGTVAEVLVDEGQEVREGQALVRLDAESVARLQMSYAQADLDFLDAVAELETTRAANRPLAEAGLALNAAVDELEALVGPDPQALADAESAAAVAAIALRDARKAFDDVSEPSAAVVAEAEAAVAEAAIELRDAEDALGGEALAASGDVAASLKDLSVAEQDLTIAQDGRSLDNAIDALENSEQEYTDAMKKWSGVVLTDEDLEQPPEMLFDAWDFDPAVIYASGYDLFPKGVFEDNADTRWNELSVYAWVALHPSGSSIEVTCDTESEEVAVTTAGRTTVSAAQQFCIQRDTENSWQALQDSRLELDTQLAQAEKRRSQAEAAVIRAENDLDESQKAFSGLDNGPELDLLKHKFIIAAQGMADAEQDLQAVLGPDPLELNRISALLAAALATYDDALKALDEVRNADPLALAIARANSDAAKRALENAGDVAKMELALEEARVASAKALLDGARQRFENSTLRAPWSGFVSAVHVEIGQVVQATTEIVNVVDRSVVEVEGIVDEIDVLSLIRGAQATVTMDALPGQTLTGTVSTISSAATSQQGVVTFDVEIQVHVPDGLRLQEGLSAVANVALSRERGLLVPNDAIHGSISQPQVMVNDRGSLEERNVVLGNSDGFWTIVQAGLSAGDQVVIEVLDANTQQLGFRGFGGGGGGNFRGGGGGGGNPGGGGDDH